MAPILICENSLRAIDCIVCGARFDYAKVGPGRLPRFCSAECRGAQTSANVARYKADGRYDRRNMEAAARRYASRPPADFACAECEVGFKSRQRVARYCSPECSGRGAIRLSRDNNQARHCASCGENFTPTGGANKFCSRVCSQRALDAQRSAHRRGAAAANYVDPYRVFVRDGWCCQICGGKTPRSLRGKHKDRSPELDHILPLSKGGPHTYDNVQCACRRCNLRKGSSPYGQIPLFA
jgi:5-methylcytosine-specific restriction endonuclease McrA